MDSITVMFAWAIFWAIVGLITTLIWGLDVPKYIADFVVLLVVAVGPIVFITSQGYTDIDQTASFIAEYITNFMYMIPGLMVGEIVSGVFDKIKNSLGH